MQMQSPQSVRLMPMRSTTPEGGEGLEGLMYACRDKLFGILNGLDYTEYDPQKDVYLTNHYNEVNYKEGKALNKTRLQKCVSSGRRGRISDRYGIAYDRPERV